MNTAEIESLAVRIADILIARLSGRVQPAAEPVTLCPRQLTVEQFAVCVRRSPEVVRRRIRDRFIPREYVFGPPYAIDRAALAKFKVPLDLAVERLAAPAKPAE